MTAIAPHSLPEQVHLWWRSFGARPAVGGSPDLSCLETAAQALRDCLDAGLLNVSLPGECTAERWAVFEAFASIDLTLVRLVEGHADAVAILHELGHGPVDSAGGVWGVWAASPKSIRATPTANGWRLRGSRKWCSGAAVCTRALVTAETPDGVGLFVIDNDGVAVSPVPESWPAVGMAGTDSRTVDFVDAPAEQIGKIGAYVERPGFWHGGAGVAACWYGGAVGVAEALRSAAAKGSADPHRLAHLGAVDAALAAGRATLDACAQAIDADPGDVAGTAARRTLQTRMIIESVAEQVLRHTGRALGATPLCQDRAHARRVADLSVYIRQSHAESDLEALGRLAAHSQRTVYDDD